MKWILFTGTWRLTNDEVERDVRNAAREVIARGDGILTGGATGVDFFAMDEALSIQPSATHLRVIIPAKLKDYIVDYHTNWCQEPITKDHIEVLHELLVKLRDANPASLFEMPYKILTQAHYDLRNEQEVMYSDEVYAFQVNNSTGTQHTIDAAKKAGLPIAIHKQYTI